MGGFDTTQKELNQLMAPILYKRPSCAMVTNYTKSGRKFRHYVTIYLLSTDSNISHYFGITTFVEFLNVDKSSYATKRGAISQDNAGSSCGGHDESRTKSLSNLTNGTNNGSRGESGVKSNEVVA